MNFVLRHLTINDEQAFLKGLHLFSDMEPTWYSFVYKEGVSYIEMLNILENNRKGINIPDSRVPDSMLYAFLDGEIIGRVSVRHELNDYLFSEGGHIGYAVATKYRNRGYATLMLNESLTYCRETLKLEKVLLTCDDDNSGSYCVIEKCGGVIESKNISNDGTTIKRRYWIKL